MFFEYKNIIISFAILLQYEKEDFEEADGDQDGGVRGRREGGNTACHFCQGACAKALDREES